MTIYKKRTHHSIYRRIYKNHYGPIPKDDEGRSYDIHHIDGDPLNNHPSNLEALSKKDHYDIHYSQGDWGACLRISASIDIDPEEKSRLAKMAVAKQIKDGKHPFVTRPDGTNGAQDKVKNGTHPWQKRPDGTSIASDQKKNLNYKNPFSRREDGTSVASDMHNRPDFVNPFSLRKAQKHHRYDANIYTFINKLTNEIVTMSQQDFVKFSKCDQGSISRLVRGKYKSVKRWVILPSAIS